ncbi:MAG: alanine racemase [Thermodesulfovibrionales bacterium]
MHRGAIAEIDLDCISHNLNLIKKITGLPVIAVVKADAYGHGALEVSRRLLTEGVSYLAVAYLEEGVRLREAGINAPILALFERKEFSGLIDYNLIPLIHDMDMAERLSEEAIKRNMMINVHVKIDTGMGRLGFKVDKAIDEIERVAKLGNLRIRGIMSHFSEADIADRDYAMRQIHEFMRIRDALNKKFNGILYHIANSAAVFSMKDSYLDAVRPGLALYGYSPFPDLREDTRAGKLRPSMTVKTRILAIRKVSKGTAISYGRTFITTRDSLIALLPVGYADGFMRSLSNNADVLIRGKRAPVVGRVCMDLTMVDVTGIDDVSTGDDVILIGRQGDEEITTWELAKRAGTIPYEITISLGSRSRRVYLYDAKTTKLEQ